MLCWKEMILFIYCIQEYIQSSLTVDSDKRLRYSLSSGHVVSPVGMARETNAVFALKRVKGESLSVAGHFYIYTRGSGLVYNIQIKGIQIRIKQKCMLLMTSVDWHLRKVNVVRCMGRCWWWGRNRTTCENNKGTVVI